MNAQDLRNSILQLAVQGKLVEQRAEDGTAEELYRQIADEKARLIKVGKIPKEKALPEISDEEKEFVLPLNWKYVRVQNVATYITDYVANGSFAVLKKNTTTYKEKNYAIFVRTMDLTANFETECSYIDKTSYNFLEKSKLYGGELILPNIGGSIGKAFIMPDLGMPMSLAPNSIMIKFTETIMNKFFSYVIQSPYGYKFLADTKGGTATPKFSKTELKNMVIMLPPLTEIERIVTRIEEILPYIEQYGKVHTKLEIFNKKFPEDMKKSILQLAMQGRLVEQRPEEGTADELYGQIVAEKARLIKEGKIKAGKPLPEIGEDEIPFEIPKSWKWVRLGNIVYSGGQKKPDKCFSYIDIGSIDNIHQKLNSKDNIIEADKAPSRARKIVKYGDVLYATVRPYLHNACIIDRELCEEPIASTGFAVMTCCKGILNKYLLSYLLSPEFDKYANSIDNAKGVAYPAINDDRFYKAVIPVPPYEEQKRIIAKIEEILPYCVQLIK